MKHNILFIEGLPGSGKTTFARRLKKHYEQQGVDVALFNEGDLHPIDLAWCSYCTKDQFDEIIQRFPNIEEALRSVTSIEDGKYISAYTRVSHPSVTQEFYDYMEQFEVYRYTDLQRFLDVHIKRWSYFNLHFDPRKLYIFECILLQNHITELVLNHNASYHDMYQYIETLLQQINNQKPVIYYIKQNNIERTFHRIIEERRSDQPDLYRDWIDNVIRYLDTTKYAEELQFTGIEGMIRYGTYRQETECSILDDLPVDSHVFEPEEDYDRVFTEMIQKEETNE
ncbi:hypothetical protein [Candidatus Xianfuyuplasma coldseepsis]|uniref:Deoxynucleoside kinase domain-containing protein n=1 Tax=Candidatus Xianfuyuplasma coldseepsis TaxID=2782163 RepID=A0A7L7KQW5_9MOLU|nr:hypothetical protein [Xianfuyuplasma coldseepsis]QMS84672.1 hypothetical protein G4Z02_02535 [Xianfuyuplasma coldseepsis]